MSIYKSFYIVNCFYTCTVGLVTTVDMQVCVILKAATNLGVDSYFVAAMAFVVLIVILGFLVHVLDNVIDTVYICYAVDRDKGDVCKADVHEIYVHLPISRNNNPSYLNARTPLLV